MKDLKLIEHEEKLPSLSGVTCQTVKKEERKLVFKQLIRNVINIITFLRFSLFSYLK